MDAPRVNQQSPGHFDYLACGKVALSSPGAVKEVQHRKALDFFEISDLF